MNESMIKKNIGNIIRSYRKNANLTQSELGNIIGINQRQIALIENGKSFPQLSTMTKLAKAFNCSVCDFFEDISSENNTTMKERINNFIQDCSEKELKQIYKIIKTIKLI